MLESRWRIAPIVFLALLALAGAACTPKASAPPQAPAAPKVESTASAPSKAPASAAADDAWNKVVEAARKEGKLTSYGFNLAGDPGKAIVKAFEEKYGIKVELVTGPGSVLIERIKSEKAAGKGVADVFDTAASLLGAAKDQGLTDTVGDIPALAQKNAWFVNPVVDSQAHVISVSPSVVTPYVNTRLVKPEDEPKSYKDLLATKWKGKIAIGTPSIVQIFNYVYMARQGLGLDDDFWRQLGKQDLQIAPGLRETDALIVKGEAAIEFPGTTSTLAPLVLQGAPIKAIAMKEGVVVGQGPAFAVMKDAVHPNAARLFVNWLLSPEGQDTMSKARGVETMRKDVPSSTPPAARVSFDKVVNLSGEQQLDTDRVMREGVLAKLMGLKAEK